MWVTESPQTLSYPLKVTLAFLPPHCKFIHIPAGLLFIPYQMDLKFTRALYSKGLSSLKKEGATLNFILTF